MAATVLIGERNGTAATFTDKSSGTVRFKNADNATVDLANPLVKPSSGFDYSFEKYLRLNVSGGTFTQITNANAYTDGTSGMGAGVEVFVKTGTYVAPVEATGTAGFVSAFSYTSGSPLALNVGTVVGTGQTGDHIIAFCRIGTGVSGGIVTSETLTVSWDEI